MFRGGSWGYFPDYCRSAFRYGCAPSYRNGDVGFGVARSQSAQELSSNSNVAGARGT